MADFQVRSLDETTWPDAQAVSPALSGLAIQVAAFEVPFFLGGGLKIAYDLALYPGSYAESSTVRRRGLQRSHRSRYVTHQPSTSSSHGRDGRIASSRTSSS
jgi:hypothetical protein